MFGVLVLYMYSKHTISQYHTILIKTQTLTIPFCADYILNEKYQILNNEKYIDLSDIKKTQPHLNTSDIIQYNVDKIINLINQ